MKHDIDRPINKISDARISKIESKVMKFSLGAGVISSALLCLVSATANAQQNIDYAGIWACSYVQSYRSVDVKDWQLIKLSRGSLQYPGTTQVSRFTSKAVKTNVLRITYQDGVLEQWSLLSDWMTTKENSEQTQICLRQEN